MSTQEYLFSAAAAYAVARIHGFTKELQETACKEPSYAYWFARMVKGADIEYCKQHMDEFLLDNYLRCEMAFSLR